MRAMTWSRGIGLLPAAMLLWSAGCGEDKPAGDAGAAAASGSASGTAATKPKDPSKPKPRPKDGDGASGGGASSEAAARFTTWTPLHAFLGAPVVAASIVSDHE